MHTMIHTTFTKEKIDTLNKIYPQILNDMFPFTQDCTSYNYEKFYKFIQNMVENVIIFSLNNDTVCEEFKLSPLPSPSPLNLRSKSLDYPELAFLSLTQKNSLQTFANELILKYHRDISFQASLDHGCSLLQTHCWLLHRQLEYQEITRKIFSPLETKILLKFLMTSIMQRNFSSTENDNFDRYIEVCNGFDNDMDFYPGKPIATILIYHYNVCDFDPTIIACANHNSIIHQILHILRVYDAFFIAQARKEAQNTEIQNSDPHNLLLDFAFERNFIKALYDLYRDYSSNMTYSIRQHLKQYWDSSNNSDASNKDISIDNISSRFSNNLQQMDVTYYHTYNHTLRSNSNFNRNIFFKPLLEDAHYIDLLFMATQPPSNVKVNASSVDSAQTYEDNISVYNFFKESVSHKMFSDTTMDNCLKYSEHIRNYIKSIKGDPIPATAITPSFITTINTSVKYLLPAEDCTNFEYLTFLLNPLTREWLYYKSILSEYKTPRSEGESNRFNFLIALKKLPDLEIRQKILENSTSFCEAFRYNKTWIDDYAYLLDVHYKITADIILKTLHLPDKLDNRNSNFYNTSFEALRTYVESIPIQRITSSDLKIIKSKYKALHMLISPQKNL